MGVVITWEQHLFHIGYEHGYAIGFAEGTRLVLLCHLHAKFGVLPADVSERIGAITDQRVLDDLLERILTAETLGQMGLDDLPLPGYALSRQHDVERRQSAYRECCCRCGHASPRAHGLGSQRPTRCQQDGEQRCRDRGVEQQPRTLIERSVAVRQQSRQPTPLRHGDSRPK